MQRPHEGTLIQQGTFGRQNRRGYAGRGSRRSAKVGPLRCAAATRATKRGHLMSIGSLSRPGNGLQSKLLWLAVAALGAVSFAILALSRGESVNAAWLVIAAVCTYCIA